MIYDLRRGLYAHLQRMSLRFFTNTKSGELMSRLNNDVVNAQNAISNTIVGIVTNSVTVIENQTPMRRYAGTDEDLVLVSMIDGLTIPANSSVTVGMEGSLVVNTLISLMGTFDNEIGIIGIQQYNPGFPPFTTMPGLYLNNFGYPAQALLQQTLIPGGITVQLNVPFGTAGTRYMVQGFAVTPIALNGIGAFTDALEFRVLP